MIGMLVIFNKRCKAANIDLRFRNVSTAVMEVIALARLDEVFEIIGGSTRGNDGPD